MMSLLFMIYIFRPIVVIQVQSLLKSRTKMSPFIKQLTATQVTLL